jgi:hypothetical protein
MQVVLNAEPDLPKLLHDAKAPQGTHIDRQMHPTDV